MSGLFSEEATVVVKRSRPQAQQSSESQEKVFLDTSGTDSVLDDLHLYDSPLLDAAGDLLSILVTIPRQGVPRNIERFRQQVLDGISEFKNKGLYLDYHPSVIDKSCFVLCAAFDEAVLYTRWGQASRWENYSLLSKVFSQRNGGEAFFVLLNKAKEQPTKLVDFLELQYVLMMLGFKGRFRHGEENELNEIKAETYSVIRHFREEKPLLSPQTPELKNGKQPTRPLSLTKSLILMGSLLLLAYAASEYWYLNRSEPFIRQLDQLNQVSMKLTDGGGDLVYVSSDSDIGVKPKAEPQQQKPATPVTQREWELMLGSFTKREDADSLLNTLKRSGYDVSVRNEESRNEESRFDVILNAGSDLSAAKKLKNEINVRFGLSATLERAQK